MVQQVIYNSVEDFKKRIALENGKIELDRDPLDMEAYINRKKLMQEYVYLIKLNKEQVGDFVKDASKFEADIDICSVDKQTVIVDAKSLIGVMSLDLGQPLQIQIHTGDADEYVKFCKAFKDYAI